jgi:hypothetical protein
VVTNIPPAAHYSGVPTVSGGHGSGLPDTWAILTLGAPKVLSAGGILVTAGAHKFGALAVI